MKDKNNNYPFKQEGMVIQAFRESKGWTQKEIADKLSTSLNTISMIENGRRGISANMLKNFAKLGLNLDDISFISRNEESGHSFAYRLSEVENRLAKMEATLTKIYDFLNEKK